MTRIYSSPTTIFIKHDRVKKLSFFNLIQGNSFIFFLFLKRANLFHIGTYILYILYTYLSICYSVDKKKYNNNTLRRGKFKKIIMFYIARSKHSHRWLDKFIRNVYYTIWFQTIDPTRVAMLRHHHDNIIIFSRIA